MGARTTVVVSGITVDSGLDVVQDKAGKVTRVQPVIKKDLYLLLWTIETVCRFKFLKQITNNISGLL